MEPNLTNHNTHDLIAAIGTTLTYLTGSMVIGALTVIYLLFGIALRWREWKEKWSGK